MMRNQGFIYLLYNPGVGGDAESRIYLFIYYAPGGIDEGSRIYLFIYCMILEER